MAASFKDIFSESSVAVDVSAGDKASALNLAVEVLARNGKVPDPKSLLKEIRERESRLTTSIGAGVAVPHALSDAVGELMFAVLRLKEGVDFGASDGQPVDIIFLISGPRKEPGSHLQLLSKIARLCHDVDFRQAIRLAPDAKAMTDLIYAKD
jgi:fructose-specific phosphotransferase system IIA component